MPSVIVLNGPPAIGKSTIACRYADEHAGTLNLDIDRLRRFVGGWRSDPSDANLLAREFALAAARAHLLGGHDVMVPQYLGRIDYLLRLAELADETGSSLHEFVLLETKDRVLERFAARTRAAAHPSHVDAQRILDENGGVAQLEGMYDRLLLVIAARPNAQVIGAPDGEIEQTYRSVLRRLNQTEKSTTTGA